MRFAAVLNIKTEIYFCDLLLNCLDERINFDEGSDVEAFVN